MNRLTDSKNYYGSGPAEVYAHTPWRQMSYRRFETVADAIRFFMEELPVRALGSAVIEVDGEERLGRAEISCLYESARYPLVRCLAAADSDLPRFLGGMPPAAGIAPPLPRGAPRREVGA